MIRYVGKNEKERIQRMENNFDNNLGGQPETVNAEIDAGQEAVNTETDTRQEAAGTKAEGQSAADSAGEQHTGADAGYAQANSQQYSNSYGNYQQPEQNYQQQYQDNFNYNVGSNTTGYNRSYSDDNAPMTMGEWILTLLLMSIPCVNIVLCCVWAFGNTGNVNRRNFCRAELIFMGIGIVLGIIMVVIVAAVGIGASSYYYY